MKDIPGFEGEYAVTEDGKVWSYGRHTTKLGNTFYKQGRFLKPQIRKGGRYSVLLQIGFRKLKPFQIHRLVSTTYLPNPQGLPEVNHKNGIPADNRLLNLEWCTRRQNVDHAVVNLLYPFGERQVNSKLTEVQVREILDRYIPRKVSSRKLAEEYGVTKNAILRIVNRKGWRHIK